MILTARKIRGVLKLKEVHTEILLANRSLLLYSDGFQDFLKYGDGEKDFVLYK